MSSPHDIERVRGAPGDSVGNSAAVYWPCPSLDEVGRVMVMVMVMMVTMMAIFKWQGW